LLGSSGIEEVQHIAVESADAMCLKRGFETAHRCCIQLGAEGW
jgi:hypothetical protein